MVTVALVDDHPVLVSGMVELLSENPDVNVVATGKSARDLTDIAGRLRPDVIVTDYSMPGDVIEAVSQVARLNLGTRMLIFTASSSIEGAISVLEAGATGYALKGASVEDLVEAIHQVHAGECYITPSFAMKVIAGLKENARRAACPRVVFSRREDQVLRLLLKGRTNKEIALALEIAEKTVKHYMSVLMQKLNARNRLEVVLAAQSLAGRDGMSQHRMH